MASRPLSAVCSCRAGRASTTSTAAEATAAITGWRRTGRRIAPHTRPPSAPSRRRRPTNGIRPFSTRSPSADRTAGRTVSEPIMATKTTIIVPTANDMKVLSPEKNIPAIAIITVKPEIRTARPEVAAAAGGPRPRCVQLALVALAAHVEERVVHPDRQADQEDDLADPSVHRDELAGQRDQAHRREHGGQPERHRDQRRRQRADDQQQDEDRQRDRDQPGPPELGADELWRAFSVETPAEAT